ncbi:hypothetical protein GCM10023205_68270 [Yinghuangia aomiensis]|uniref:Twin-arginine translocation signal domain-containing protein n=2 Tax=Yinghuangia aomiensis TaxID=676205 RepID=A0ABP9I539_9ACTN
MAAAVLGKHVREREARLPSGGLDRRRFLAGLGAAGLAAFTLAACSDDSNSPSGKRVPVRACPYAQARPRLGP